MAEKRKKVRDIIGPVTPPTYKLTPEDLREFELRRMTLNTAKCQMLMVEEAYLQWLKGIRLRYDIPTAKFQIDPATGTVTPQGDRNG